MNTSPSNPGELLQLAILLDRVASMASLSRGDHVAAQQAGQSIIAYFQSLSKSGKLVDMKEPPAHESRNI